ncbi:MAG: formate dehydrogenase accessory sulfurtransferase FdhD [Ruminiclostridium sp.]|nr:formate dehydrogenase accessory sulfurtransferase FdhD [Ruminiclostridium sp.]
MDITKKYTIKRVKDGQIKEENDSVIVEYPFTIFLNKKEFIRLLCTPRSLKNLAAGFLFSEGIINSKSDLEAIELDEEKGKAYAYTKNKDHFDYKGNSLCGTRTITTACGKQTTVLYGVIDFLGTESDKIETSLNLEPDEVLNLANEFNKKSELYINTGGVHSCALCDRQGIILFEEDVGRHNALDKILGYALLEDICLTDKIIITSGRISSEMALKVVKSKIPVLVSRSAPTDTAVETARKFNLTLIGFARGRRMNIYSGSL